MRISQRSLIQSGGLLAAGSAGLEPSAAAPATGPTPEVYTRIGVRPFINCNRDAHDKRRLVDAARGDRRHGAGFALSHKPG
jgi:hypothetical protein